MVRSKQTRKIKEEVVCVHVIKLYVRVELQFQSFLTAKLVGNEWLALRSGRFTPR